MQDITAQREAERILRQQNAILEMVATGRPLADILRYVSGCIELEIPDCACGILIVDHDREHWRVGTNGSIPHSVMDGIADKLVCRGGALMTVKRGESARYFSRTSKHGARASSSKIAGRSTDSMTWLLHPVRRDSGNSEDIAAEFCVLLDGGETTLAIAERAIQRIENLVRIVPRESLESCRVKSQ